MVDHRSLNELSREAPAGSASHHHHSSTTHCPQLLTTHHAQAPAVHHAQASITRQAQSSSTIHPHESSSTSKSSSKYSSAGRRTRLKTFAFHPTDVAQLGRAYRTSGGGTDHSYDDESDQQGAEVHQLVPRQHGRSREDLHAEGSAKRMTMK